MKATVDFSVLEPEPQLPRLAFEAIGAQATSAIRARPILALVASLALGYVIGRLVLR
jgi:hypothetical protein